MSVSSHRPHPMYRPPGKAAHQAYASSSPVRSSSKTCQDSDRGLATLNAALPRRFSRVARPAPPKRGCARSARQASGLSFCAARCSAVEPSRDCAAAAPKRSWPRIAWQASPEPHQAARCRAVTPSLSELLSAAVNLGWSRSVVQACAWPPRAARCSAVRPSLLTASAAVNFGWSRSCWHSPTFPRAAASCSAVLPSWLCRSCASKRGWSSMSCKEPPPWIAASCRADQPKLLALFTWLKRESSRTIRTISGERPQAALPRAEHPFPLT
mmetsp:Transcript_94707/g.276974  ORF Transcript_94707/g.276974 Transcript_94707/m.276974 type:complete len:269 (+) Transcript_94707:286-1092(+)